MESIQPGDKITNPYTGKVNTVWKLEHIHLNIMRVRLRTGVSLDYRPGTVITLPNGSQASVGQYA